MNEASEPEFAVRISRGLVTHWQDGPLLTWHDANECRRALLDYCGEVGEIERVTYHRAERSVLGADKSETSGRGGRGVVSGREDAP